MKKKVEHAHHYTFDIHRVTRGLTHTLSITRGYVVSTKNVGEDLIFLPSSTCLSSLPPSTRPRAIPPSSRPGALPPSSSPGALPPAACFDGFRRSCSQLKAYSIIMRQGLMNISIILTTRHN